MSILFDAIEFFTPASAPSESTSTDSARGRNVTSLYACSTCDLTYIESASAELRSCPHCGGPVEQTPSFAELGIDPPGRRP